MSGSAIEVFEDFVLSTSPANLTGPNDIVNDCTKNKYILGRFMRGREMARMVQGGEYIKDEIYLEEKRTSRNYKINEKQNWQNPQVLERWSTPWRFTMDEITWTDQEVELNNADLSDSARFKKYKDMKYSKEMRTWTGLMNFLEENLVAPPDYDEMEGTDGTTPYSIPTFITEKNAVPTNWTANSQTSVMGIDTEVYSKWDNQRVTYARAAALSSGSGRHLLNAFDSCARQMSFDSLPMYANLSERRNAPYFWMASDLGVYTYEDALRVNQDTFRWGGGQDPAYPHPTHKGVDILYNSSLDGALLHPTGDANGTVDSYEADDSGTTNAGPRYYGVDARYMLKAIHARRFFFKKPAFSPSNQPWNHIMPVDLWHNNCCRSRQRQGLIYPSADITTPA